ncbi:MAG: MMPL family transporter [Thermonemataceae bacterium]|nr:MMPL family transporter [Thermonemataceae bacterium]
MQAFLRKFRNLKNIWFKFGEFILRFRLLILIFLVLSTILMGYWGTKVTLKYEFTPVVPESDSSMLVFRNFKKTFGEDGNMFVVGFQDKRLYELKNFQKYYEMCKELKKLEGVTEVLSLAVLEEIKKDDSLKKFISQPIFKQKPTTQEELDKNLALIRNIKLYENLLFNPQTNATIIGISIDADYLNSAKRLKLTPKIIELSLNFEKETGIKAHFGGLPYVRSIVTGKVKSELQLFLFISVIVTAIVILLFFRSWQPVLVAILVIAAAVLWSMGTMHLLGYQITALTGLMPPLLVVIAVPNCIYLINKYQQEYLDYGDKNVALKNVIVKIGFLTVIVNVTTAIGFVVFVFGNVEILAEFGLVISLNTMITFFLSIFLIPIFYSYLPVPSAKSVEHLEFKPIKKFLHYLVELSLKKRKWIYLVNILAVIVSLIGMLMLKPLAFLVDDLPKTSGVRSDLAFFEQNFKGVMPLEIIIDTKQPKGLRKRGHLSKVDSLETELYKLPEIAKPLSIVPYLKNAYQVYFNGDSSFYTLPDQRNWVFFQKYISQQNTQNKSNIARFFVDSTEQKMRISLKVADIGTIRMEKLLKTQIEPMIKRAFANTNVKASVTGTSAVFVKSNQYLIDSLLSGMLSAILLVAIAHAFLFTNLKLIIISLIPNIIPMLVTAGLMGFLGIPLKPSTMIIFSIVLGIAVDNTVHFLAHYRLQLDEDSDHIHAVIASLKETGHSMIYTSVVLFAGFATFVASEFGGTVALGSLTSITLFVALLTNLTILPALLISFDKQKVKKTEEEYIQESDKEDNL